MRKWQSGFLMSFNVYIRWTKMEIDMGKFDFLSDKRFAGLVPFTKKVWLASPTMHGEEQKYVDEAIRTNWVSTVGENIDEVERMAAKEIGCGYAVALSSGTAALHLGVRLCGEKLYGQPKLGRGALYGQRVFCSDMTFDATVNPVVYEGGEPVFIDTEYDTWNMDPDALCRAFSIYPKVRLVVVAHLYGTPGKIDEILAICKQVRGERESLYVTEEKKAVRLRFWKCLPALTRRADHSGSRCICRQFTG